MLTSLDVQQEILRRAITVLEAGPVWDPEVPEHIRGVVDRSQLDSLRSALADHENDGHCSCYMGECRSVTTARRVLALAGRRRDIVAMRKVILTTVDPDPLIATQHVDDVTADRIAAAVLVYLAGVS
jgi:hypothetical protein